MSANHPGVDRAPSRCRRHRPGHRPRHQRCLARRSPAPARSGPADLVISGGVIESGSLWLGGRRRRRGSTIEASWLRPASSISTLTFASRAATAAETIASGLAAAAHGGFTAVCAMPNTSPPIDRAAMVLAAEQAASAVRQPRPAAPVRRHHRWAGRGSSWRRSVSSPTPASSASATTARPSRTRPCSATPSRTRRCSGCRSSTIPRTSALTAGAEASEGLVATVLGLKGWPAAAEAEAVARDIALLADVVRDNPSARLHLTHLSTAGSLAHVRAAKAAGLPVTCDVTPHHLALTDEWLAGSRRWAWEALDDDGAPRDPWRDRAIVAAPVRHRPSGEPAAPLGRGRPRLPGGPGSTAPSTPSPRTTRRTPRSTSRSSSGRLGPGIAGIETALGLLLEAVDAGLVPLARVVEALTHRAGTRARPARGAARVPAASRSARRRISSSSIGRSAGALGRRRLRTRGFGHPLDRPDAAGRGAPDRRRWQASRTRHPPQTDRRGPVARIRLPGWPRPRS